MSDLRSRHILLVDDELGVLRVVSRQLAPLGGQVTTAQSAEEALQLLGAIGPMVDCVIADVGLGGMDGITLIEEIQARWPKIIRVLLTGAIQEQKAIDLVASGLAFKVIRKPWTAERITAAVSEAFETMLDSEEVLARDWDTPEEDEAWADL